MALKDMFLCSLQIGGRLAKDPRMHTTSTGKMVCFFTVCYNSARGQRGIFFNFIAFKELAEYIVTNYKKGDYIWVTHADGLEPQDYPDKVDRNKTVKTELWKAWEVKTAVEKLSHHTYDKDDGLPF